MGLLPFPARVTCSDGKGGQVLAGVIEGSMDSCPHQGIALLGQHLSTELLQVPGLNAEAHQK